MKKLLTLLLCFIFIVVFAQEKASSRKNFDAAVTKADGSAVKKGTALKAFGGAGFAVRTDHNYFVTISPIDYTVHFQNTPRLTTGITTGFVWNPFSTYTEETTTTTKDNITTNNTTQYRSKDAFCFALLFNVLKFASAEQNQNSTTPVDVGFGLGYNKNNLMVILTAELNPLRQPTDYFIDNYKDQNKTLILANSAEPVRTVSVNDDSLFYTKIYCSVGLKVAYSFGE